MRQQTPQMGDTIVNMSRALVILATVAILIGCSQPYAGYDPIWPEISLNVASPQDLGRWEVDNITYDANAGTQSAQEVWDSRRAKCTGFSMLFMYVVRQEFCSELPSSEWPELAGGTWKGEKHSWVIWEGKWYEPQGGFDVTSDANYQLTDTVEYSEAEWIGSQLYEN